MSLARGSTLVLREFERAHRTGPCSLASCRYEVFGNRHGQRSRDKQGVAPLVQGGELRQQFDAESMGIAGRGIQIQLRVLAHLKSLPGNGTGVLRPAGIGKDVATDVAVQCPRR